LGNHSNNQQALQNQLMQPKWTIFKEIMAEQNISILYGDDANYFDTLDVWINSL